jgi:hypothetical protein
MTTEAWLKSGLVGGTITSLIALILMLPVPALSCCGYPLMCLFFVGTGVLTAQALPPHWGPRIVGGLAATAGLVASLLSGLALVISSVLQTVFFPDQITDLASRTLESLPPDIAGRLGEPGVLDAVVTPGRAALSGGLCCGMNVIVGVALAVLGGLVWSAMRRL